MRTTSPTMPTATPTPPTQLPPLWTEIETFLTDIARRSTAMDQGSSAFFGELLQGATQLLGSPVGALWLRERNEGYALACEHFSNTSQDADHTASSYPCWATESWIDFHRQAFRALKTPGVSLFYEPHSGHRGQIDLTNPSHCLVVFAPIRGGHDIVGALEFVLSPASRPEARLGYQRFVETLTRILEEHLQQAGSARWEQSSIDVADSESLMAKLHDSLDSERVAYILANEGRSRIGCDRLTVAIRQRQNTRIAAVSGTDRIEHHAYCVQRLEELAEAVLVAGEPLEYSGACHDLPPELESLIQHYVDASHAKTLTIVPIDRHRLLTDDDVAPREGQGTLAIGALISEQFARRECVPIKQLTSLADTAANALGNALDFEQIPYAHTFLRWRSALPRTRRQWVKWLAIAGTATLLVLLLYPAKLFVSVTGELQPRDRRHVYALADGVIDSIDVKHGQQVRQGERLAVMRNPELEAQIESLATELHAAEAEWEGVKSALIDRRVDRADVARDEHQLSAKKKALEHQVEALNKQLEILQAQHARLELVSPIDGQVITWDLHQRLADRPVRHGETLLTVADPDAAWILELHVPDRRIGHVIKASQNEEPLPVRFILTADPAKVHDAAVAELAVAAEYDRLYETTVRVTAKVADSSDLRKLPGAEVKAKLDCGRHPLGFVWFHGLIDWIRSSLLL